MNRDGLGAPLGNRNENGWLGGVGGSDGRGPRGIHSPHLSLSRPDPGEALSSVTSGPVGPSPSPRCVWHPGLSGSGGPGPALPASQQGANAGAPRPQGHRCRGRGCPGWNLALSPLSCVTSGKFSASLGLDGHRPPLWDEDSSGAGVSGVTDTECRADSCVTANLRSWLLDSLPSPASPTPPGSSSLASASEAGLRVTPEKEPRWLTSASWLFSTRLVQPGLFPAPRQRPLAVSGNQSPTSRRRGPYGLRGITVVEGEEAGGLGGSRACGPGWEWTAVFVF